MRTGPMLALVLVPLAASAQRAPRLEVAGGATVPATARGVYEGTGPSLRLTALRAPAAARWAARADLAYGAPSLSARSTLRGAGDVTALTLGGEWRAAAASALPPRGIRPYAAAGVGVVSGYYGNAAGGADGRATGAAVTAAIGARRGVGRVTLGAEIGYAVYGPVRRTGLIPVTLALGF